MRRYKFNGKEFEMEYFNDIAPVVLATKTPLDNVDLKQLTDKFQNVIINSYDTMTYDDDDNRLIPVTFYYTGAEAVDIKRYKSISYYNKDNPPNNMLIETTLQNDRYKRIFYTPVKNINCSMMDLLDKSLDHIISVIFSTKNDYDYTTLELYDNCGWEEQIEIEESDIKDMITNIRLVEGIGDEKE